MGQVKGDKLRLGWGLGSWLISHCLCDVLNTASTCSLVQLPKCKGLWAHELPLLPTDCAQWICRRAGVWWIWGENNCSSWALFVITQWLSCACARWPKKYVWLYFGISSKQSWWNQTWLPTCKRRFWNLYEVESCVWREHGLQVNRARVVKLPV